MVGWLPLVQDRSAWHQTFAVMDIRGIQTRKSEAIVVGALTEAPGPLV